jgi:hypothetical protein
MKIMHHYNNKKGTRRGFTLIETLVAIAIIMLSVAGPLIIAQKGISSAIYARDQITAAYLAQDAVEYIPATNVITTYLRAHRGLMASRMNVLELITAMSTPWLIHAISVLADRAAVPSLSTIQIRRHTDMGGRVITPFLKEALIFQE